GRDLCTLKVAERGATPDRGRLAGFARHKELAAGPAGELVVRRRRGLLSREVVMGDMRPEYRETVEKTLREFVRNGDDVMCVAIFCIQDRTCQVCGHHPITWNYLIENLVTHQLLI